MNIASLLPSLTPIAVSGETNKTVSDLTHDSRTARPGCVFFAVPGSKTDGNRHIKEACERGAIGIVSELPVPPPPLGLPACWIQVSDIAAAMGRAADVFFGHPSKFLRIIGVTGTNGKTTTVYYLESIFTACGLKTGVLGTISHRFTGKWEQPSANTTPSSLETARILARLRDEGATHVAMEVSSHALALKRADEIDFDAAIFTNLASDHLDFHETTAKYANAKKKLFEMLSKPSSSKKSPLAVINADDPMSDVFKRAASGSRIVLFGLTPQSQARADQIRMGTEGTRFTLSFNSLKQELRIPMVGEHNLYNALGAASAALALGLPMEKIAAGLESLQIVPGRLEHVAAGQNFSIFVDYAHTESALKAVLNHLRRLSPRRIITVFGCGGDRDKTKRRPMGIAAGSLSDLCVLTSDNPRTEDPAAIIADIEAGLRISGAKNYKIQPDRKKAIVEAVGLAQEGDIILIAGKGHEDHQILKDGPILFDDREIAREAAAGRHRSP
ncbi:MAG: UDP-N-acetylmuramoyl-L-alanyl-D-glutamate--2,6-diaminopimelate ligase [Elusimicrobiota bacterium]